MVASSSSGACIPRSHSLGGCRSSTGRDDIACRPGGEWRIAGDHLVQDDAETPDVSALIHGLATHLLRRHVSDGAEHDAGLSPRDAACRR